MSLHDANDINFRLLLMCCMVGLTWLASNANSTKNAEKFRAKKKAAGGKRSKGRAKPNRVKRCISTRPKSKTKKPVAPWYVAPPLTAEQRILNAKYTWSNTYPGKPQKENIPL